MIAETAYIVRFRRHPHPGQYFKTFWNEDEAKAFASKIEDEGFDAGYEFLSLDTEITGR